MPRAKGNGLAAKSKVKGKWGHLVGVLPKLNTRTERFDEQDALRDQIINDYKAENGGQPPPTSFLVDQYLALRDAKDAVKSQLSDIQLELDTLTNMIEQRYEDEGLQKVTASDGAAVGMHYEPYAQVTDNDAMVEWAKKNGLERKLTLLWPTVNSEVKAALESGTAVYDGEKLVGGPDGVSVYMITKFQKRGGE